MSGEEVPVIADERDLMQAALHLMRDAFVDACSRIDWTTQGELQHRFFDGYAEAKRVWGFALLLRDVTGKPQGELALESPLCPRCSGQAPNVCLCLKACGEMDCGGAA